MLGADELRAIDDWRFAMRMPSRAAAIRELLRRGLATASSGEWHSSRASSSFRVVGAEPGD